MGFDSGTRKFRINPMEVAVFAVVSLIFVKSTLSLVADRNVPPAALEAMAANPVTENREPASSPAGAHGTIDLELKCGGTPDQETTAGKLRLRGPFCGGEIGNDGHGLSHATVANQSNKTSATVFTDLDQGKFSTDELPLNAGKNLIHVEFTYSAGKVVAKEFTLTKN